MKAILKHAAASLLAPFPRARETVKHLTEELFWRKTRWQAGGDFYNGHLPHFYTAFFGLDPEFYAGKRILDVGCGPVGSLEWADMAAERVGADPLAEAYVKLNRGKHKMRYVQASSESVPFETGHFDVVTIFNALDHVEDVGATVRELTRVCRPGGMLLLIVEIDHPATLTEPHLISRDIVERFAGFECESVRLFDLRDDHDVYRSLLEGRPLSKDGQPGILCARLVRRAEA